jgi:alkaline phosphatase D
LKTESTVKSLDTRWFDLLPGKLTRRDFIRVGRDIAGCIALASIPMPGRGVRPRAFGNPFPFGVASGDPHDTSVVLWTMLDPVVLNIAGSARAPIEVAWEIATDDNFRRIARRGVAPALSELGHSVHVEAGGLEPAREYWYRFTTGGEMSAIGRTVTAPNAASMPGRFRFAFASCQNYEHGYFTAYRHLVADQPDLVVHLGDYIYERTYGTNSPRQHEAGEVLTLDQYRARYALYRRDADLQAAHAHCPWVVTSDDHEVVNNYAGDLGEDNLSSAEFLLRRAAAYQVYYEMMPLRAGSAPTGPNLPLYRRLAFGRLIDLNVLDGRQYRSNQPCADGSKPRCAESMDPAITMLGERQERWLMTGMRESRARWNVLANQVMVSDIARGAVDSPAFTMDQWPGYYHARKRLLDFLATAKPANPVVLTGDIHSNWVSDIKADFSDPSSAVVGAELIGTSISSGGDGTDAPGTGPLSRNPHLKHYSNRRGYVLNTITPDRWTADFRTVPFVTTPGAPIETKARFVIENGKAGVQPG